MVDAHRKQSSLIDPDRKIEVYRNLHKKCWSVRQDGLVKFHCHQMSMKDCEFVVRPAGRAKVLREKRKNVHAFVRGYLWDGKLPADIEVGAFGENVSYNPYKAATFVDDENKPVYAASFVDFSKTEVIVLQSK